MRPRASLPFAQVDAFAARAFEGNPAAVMLLDAWLPDATLLAIAAEHALPETAFLVAADGAHADYALRWFSPTAEVALCGHATLAAGHVVMGTRAAVRFATRSAGVLTVARVADGYAIDLPALPPAPRPLPGVAAALGLDPATVEATLWHEAGYAVVVLADEAAVRGLAPDFRALAAFGNWLVIATAPGADTDIVSRAFAPATGVDEDPVTGSAHAVLAPYWAARLGRDRFTAHQASRRGGRLGCRLAGERAVLTGGCVTVIEGRLTF